MMLGWVKKKVKEQFLPLDSVVPEFKWSQRTRSFYINSSYGLIIYKPKNERDTARFRNEWNNKFDAEKSNLVDFYRQIRMHEKVKFSANIRARARLFYESQIS